MRFGLPDSIANLTFSFNFHVPMPGAFPPPSPERGGPSQPAAVALRRQRTRDEIQRERVQPTHRNAPGPLETALREIGNNEPEPIEVDDPEKTPTPQPPRAQKTARPRTTNNSKGKRGHRRSNNRIVYVGNLPREVTNDQIHARFSKIGKLHAWNMSCCRGTNTRQPHPNLPEGEYMATVEFVHSTAARKAVQKLHRRKWHGMPIVVSFSPWDMPTGKRLRPAVVRAEPPAEIVDNRPTPFTPVQDRSMQRREQAAWRHAQDGRRRRDEKVEQRRAERLKQTLGGASFPFSVV